MMKESNLAELISRFQNHFKDFNFTLMEVCGTHTHVIRKAGIHQLLPKGVRLLSGPGCPVCVTGSGYIEQAVRLSRQPQTIITTFGDLLRVPGNTGTLAEARAEGGQVRVVYTPLDAVEFAKAHPEVEVVFLGVGFETTAPVIALAIQTAYQQKIRNFSVLPALKVLRPALEQLLQDPAISLDGLIAPGHLGVIIGAKAFSFLVSKYQLPTVVTGFRPVELWLGLTALARQIESRRPSLENMYPQAVSEEGNPSAKQLMKDVFIQEDTEWRGLGLVPGSGMGFNSMYRSYDARVRFAMKPIKSEEPPGCLCGPILLGKEEPENCPHFGGVCQPEHPVGPCMVSTEGTCAAHFYYPKSYS
ncbi:MAG TPA: hydrogenase formation protein HypD [Firmicutes bacterium]|jgi:hydrogenase expression/formation protein HypD|nr:hydrogenase formation protein HypD [Bacillota bacterium]